MDTNVKLIRKLVSLAFNVNPKNVILSDENISPDFIPQNNRGHSWRDGAAEHSDLVAGFSFEEGIVKFDDIKCDYAFSDNGTPHTEAGETLSNYFERKNIDPSKFQFIIIKTVGKDYGENGNRFNYTTIHKTPDFKRHWEQLENSDLERWENG